MGRPTKQTVDYFSHDSNASEGRTLSILFNNFGHDGISCWWQLLEKVSGTRNHVIKVDNPEDMEFLAAKLRFTPDRLRAILTKLASLNAIDQQLWEQGIIWCQNLVDRLNEVYAARKQDLPTKPELLVPVTELPVPEIEIPVPETPQSKLKEIKVKETKEIIPPDFIRCEVWDAFVEMRKGMKAPMTERAMGLMFKKLADFNTNGADPNEILDQSIRNSWKDVYPIKDIGGNGSGKNRQEPGKLPHKYERPEDYFGRKDRERAAQGDA